MLNNHFRFDVFLISFAIGIFIVYTMQEKKRVVYRFPNPNNIEGTVYRNSVDKNKCFKIEVSEKKQCSTLNADDIREQPL